MQSSSYENILRAVGHMLDTAGARSFTLRETEGGLEVEAIGDDQERQLSLTLGVAEVNELMAWSANVGDAPNYDRAYAANEGTLHQFLARRELVGTR